MKKYLLLSLITFYSVNFKCQAMQEIDNTTINPTVRSHSQNVAFSRFESALEYFNIEKHNSSLLKVLDRNFNFLNFSYSSLLKNPQISNKLILADFIRFAAQTIISSNHYSYENKPLFNLVEALDPIYHYYAGIPKAGPLLLCTPSK